VACDSNELLRSGNGNGEDGRDLYHRSGDTIFWDLTIDKVLKNYPVLTKLIIDGPITAFANNQKLVAAERRKREKTEGVIKFIRLLLC